MKVYDHRGFVVVVHLHTTRGAAAPRLTRLKVREVCLAAVAAILGHRPSTVCGCFVQS